MDHHDPRPKPKIGVKKIISLFITSTTTRFIETYKLTNRIVSNDDGRRMSHSNRIATDLHTELMQKQVKAAVISEELHRNHLGNVSDSDEETDSDLSPSYEPVANGVALNTTNGVIDPESIVPSISSENDSEASRDTAEFQPVNKKDEKEKSSRSSKKRKRSRSSSKHEKHRSSDKHARPRSSAKPGSSRSSIRHEKQRNSDKHERSSRGSDKRDRSQSNDAQENKRKRVSPLVINKRNNTVIMKGKGICI